MKAFLAWFLGPSRALAQALAEIEYLRGELRRVNDLLTQAWEQRNIVPVQAEHRQPSQPKPEQAKTMGQRQREFEEKRLKDMADWLATEAMREQAMRQMNDAQTQSGAIS